MVLYVDCRMEELIKINGEWFIFFVYKGDE